MSTISAGTTLTTALVQTGDTTGNLVIQTNGTTTAATFDTSQNMTVVGSVRTNNILDASGGNTATINSMTPTADSLQGFRNRIINGDMRIDQRYAGTATANTINGYAVDRWSVSQSTSGKIIAQQNAGSVTPPTGFANYLGITSQSAYSVGSGDYYLIGQAIEGYNIADLEWGTANAKTVTVSFWVRSSLTGTFGGSFGNNGTARSYLFTYTISAANTWEYKTVTIAGDTSGTWEKTTSTGLNVRFGLGVGSTYSGTAGSWSGSTYFSATGATSVVGTNGATFYITGVQLEVGSTATPFERRPYGTELALCQRYYQNFAVNTYVCAGRSSSTTSVLTGIPLCVPLRASPTVTNGTVVAYSGGATASSTSAGTVNIWAANSPQVTIIFGGFSGLTDDRIYNIYSTTGAALTLSSEL